MKKKKLHYLIEKFRINIKKSCLCFLHHASNVLPSSLWFFEFGWIPYVVIRPFLLLAAFVKFGLFFLLPVRLQLLRTIAHRLVRVSEINEMIIVCFEADDLNCYLRFLNVLLPFNQVLLFTCFLVDFHRVNTFDFVINVRWMHCTIVIFRA